MSTTLDNTSPAESAWTRLDAWLTKVGDRLNPILVKEARQAMKSRQFTLTFMIVLIAAWGWTLWTVVRLGPDVAWQPSGAEFFIGYFAILAFPLALIVPYAAFRSLAQETEDRTYELLSITTLGPRQIVLGKLASAFLQILVYFSAIAPCLAFTYLLRGIDIVTILVLLSYVGLGSLGLCMTGLLAATISTERHWQIVLSVLLVIGLFWSFIGVIAAAAAIIRFGHREFLDWEFWMLMGGLLTFYISSFVIFFLAAAAQLSFPGDNRATALRVAMVAQSLLFFGWCAAGIRLDFRIPLEGFCIMLSIAGMYWAFMGSLIISESSEMSRRVQRSLPETSLGRALLTWFFPGPGRGYAFVLANIGGTVLLAFLAVLWTGLSSPTRSAFFFRRMTLESMFLFGDMLFCYLAIYLGLGLIILRAFRRRGWLHGVAAGLIVEVVLVALGVMAPPMLDAFVRRFENSYTLLYVTDPFTSLAHASFGSPDDGIVVGWLFFLNAGALGCIAANMPAIFRELRPERLAQPVRVVEEEAALHPAPRPGPTNPWDQEGP